MLALTVGLLLQAVPVVHGPPSEELREAQQRFESVRRMHLPVEHAGGGRCDVRIGRFCYWYDSAPPRAPRPEPPRISAERHRLLARFAEGATGWPGDPWIAGQRVRYLLDAGLADSAAKLSCAAAPWWCAALRGVALHVAERHAGADSAFTAALDAMPRALRCDWVNLASVLEDPLAGEMQRADCDTRTRLAGFAWRLAQPLWMTGGNEARAEHLARLTMAAILHGSATPHGTRWGSDMRELLIRYGWAERYTRTPPSGIDPSWSVLGHDREPDWNVMPRLASLITPWVRPDAWSLRARDARMRYAPRGVTALLDLPHQLVRVPRGDSMLVAVALSRPAGDPGDSVSMALGVLADTTLSVHPIQARSRVVSVAADTVIVSIEAQERPSRRAYRSRYSIAPPSCRRARVCMSDILLFAGSDSPSLDTALARALGPTVSSSTPVGVWWHVRGAAGTLTLTAVVTAERSGARRALEAARLARRRASTRIRWQVPMRADTLSAAVALRLPDGARGRHRITLTVQAPHAPPVSSSRSIDVVP